MDHRRAGKERHKETHHEIHDVIGGKDAEIPNSRRKGNHLRDSLSLFEVCLVGRHAALGRAAGSRGVDDGSNVLAAARNKRGFAVAASFFLELGFPTQGARKICAGGSLGNQNGLYVICGGAPSRSSEVAPDRIFGHQDLRA